MSTLIRCLIAATSMAVFFGCVTGEQLGDRAFENGDYVEALSYYQTEIDDGSKDSELYAKAARTAFQIGNFASAERYYSRSLSLGGGLEIARELAKLYIRTSNYGAAVRVYQYLIMREENPQPIYNNLGTALLYAGAPFDAESYLLLAQQMDPKDPFPYVNLAILYDRHLKQPWRASPFYACFHELAPNDPNSRVVQQRVAELKREYPLRVGAESVECGQAYHPSNDAAPPPLSKLREEIKLIDETFQGTDTGEAPTITDLKAEFPEKPKVVATKPDPTTAMIAYRGGRFQEAKKLFSGLAVSDFDAETTRAFGDTLRQLQEYKEAERWLEMSLGFSDVPDTVSLLVDVLVNTGKIERRDDLCTKYASRPGYTKLEKPCLPVLQKNEIENRAINDKKGKSQ